MTVKKFLKAVQIVLILIGIYTCWVYGNDTYKYYQDAQEIIEDSDGTSGFYVIAEITAKNGNELTLFANRHTPDTFKITTPYADEYAVGDSERLILDKDKHGIALQNDFDTAMHYVMRYGIITLLGFAVVLLFGSFMIMSLFDYIADKRDERAWLAEQEQEQVREETEDNMGVTIDFLAEDKLKEKLAENVRDTMHEDNKDSNSSNM